MCALHKQCVSLLTGAAPSADSAWNIRRSSRLNPSPAAAALGPAPPPPPPPVGGIHRGLHGRGRRSTELAPSNASIGFGAEVATGLTAAATKLGPAPLLLRPRLPPAGQQRSALGRRRAFSHICVLPFAPHTQWLRLYLCWTRLFKMDYAPPVARIDPAEAGQRCAPGNTEWTAVDRRPGPFSVQFSLIWAATWLSVGFTRKVSVYNCLLPVARIAPAEAGRESAPRAGRALAGRARLSAAATCQTARSSG